MPKSVTPFKEEGPMAKGICPYCSVQELKSTPAGDKCANCGTLVRDVRRFPSDPGRQTREKSGCPDYANPIPGKRRGAY